MEKVNNKTNEVKNEYNGSLVTIKVGIDGLDYFDIDSKPKTDLNIENIAEFLSATKINTLIPVIPTAVEFRKQEESQKNANVITILDNFIEEIVNKAFLSAYASGDFSDEEKEIIKDYLIDKGVESSVFGSKEIIKKSVCNCEECYCKDEELEENEVVGDAANAKNEN